MVAGICAAASPSRRLLLHGEPPVRALLLPKRLPAAAARSPRRARDPTRTQPIGPCARYLKAGWFSVGCIGRENRSLPWLSLATRYPKAYSKIDYICPQANTPRPRGCSSASPFNVLKYFTHLKGGNGMMTARANECARMGVPHADCNLQGF